MMVEAEATEPPGTWSRTRRRSAPTEEIVAAGPRGGQAVHHGALPRPSSRARRRGPPRRPREFPLLPGLPGRRLRRRRAAVAQRRSPQALTIADKQEREDRARRAQGRGRRHARRAVRGPREGDLGGLPRRCTKKLVRQRILQRQGPHRRPRPRGHPARSRPRSRSLPRVHGSALFERGETQILGVTTLNMLRHGAAARHALARRRASATCTTTTSRPTRTGETGRVGSPKRREIGHGALAERALMPVLPTREEFPYAIRQVSEALGSNGSTSMGSVCASTLSLLNAGVPLRAPVAGIAMGLVSDTVDGETAYAALTDILGAEDAFGDMDFKVAGTKRVRHRDPARHQARRHPGLGAGRRADPGPRGPAAHPRRHGRGDRRARTRCRRSPRGSSR